MPTQFPSAISFTPTQGLEPPTPTPEPATLGLMGIGALVLARKRRRALRA